MNPQSTRSYAKLGSTIRIKRSLCVVTPIGAQESSGNLYSEIERRSSLPGDEHRVTPEKKNNYFTQRTMEVRNHPLYSSDKQCVIPIQEKSGEGLEPRRNMVQPSGEFSENSDDSDSFEGAPVNNLHDDLESPGNIIKKINGFGLSVGKLLFDGEGNIDSPIKDRVNLNKNGVKNSLEDKLNDTESILMYNRQQLENFVKAQNQSQLVPNGPAPIKRNLTKIEKGKRILLSGLRFSPKAEPEPNLKSHRMVESKFTPKLDHGTAGTHRNPIAYIKQKLKMNSPEMKNPLKR